MNESYSILRIERMGHVARLVLTNEAKGNAMGPAFWKEFPEAVTELDSDDSVRVVVLCAEGKGFSYGLDLVGMMGELGPLLSGGLAESKQRLLRLIERLQDAFNVIASSSKPYIAAIHGWCIGGGLEMIVACDIRLASQDAKFSLREVKMAMVADLGGLQRLPYIIGEGHTRELALTGGDITCERAGKLGLVNHIFDDRESLLSGAMDMAEEIAQNPPLVVQGVKHVLNHCQGRRVDEGLDYVAAFNSAFLPSEDLAEAMSAFMEKRKPNFKGK
jgi:enoyl-CoA hydratase